MINRERLRGGLVDDEREVLHAYQDHLGFWTIGVGRLIDKRRGGGITHDESMFLLDNDIDEVLTALEHLPYWCDLDATRQEALCNMAFQLGVAGLLNFKNTLAAVARQDWDAAYAGALNSKWAQQTPARALRVATALRDGDSLWD